MATLEDTNREAPPPVLRFVALEDVLPHEEADQQRYTPLMKRIVDSGIWLHPPIVAPLPEVENKYIILDGANRCHSLKALDFPHILVQVTSYESGQVRLDTWNHVISGLSLADFLDNIRHIDGVAIHPSDYLTAQANLAQRDILAYVVDFENDNQVLAIHMDDHSLHGRNKTLRALVGCYQHKARLDRLSKSEPSVVQKMFPTATTLIVFPRYAPAELMVAARDDEPLPPGISRHIIEGRAMRLNYPLEELRTRDKTLAQKNEALQEWVLARIQERAVRFYAESTYVFDE